LFSDKLIEISNKHDYKACKTIKDSNKILIESRIAPDRITYQHNMDTFFVLIRNTPYEKTSIFWSEILQEIECEAIFLKCQLVIISTGATFSLPFMPDGFQFAPPYSPMIYKEFTSNAFEHLYVQNQHMFHRKLEQLALNFPLLDISFFESSSRILQDTFSLYYDGCSGVAKLFQSSNEASLRFTSLDNKIDVLYLAESLDQILNVDFPKLFEHISKINRLKHLFEYPRHFFFKWTNEIEFLNLEYIYAELSQRHSPEQIEIISSKGIKAMKAPTYTSHGEDTHLVYLEPFELIAVVHGESYLFFDFSIKDKAIESYLQIISDYQRIQVLHLFP
jgi:hypothetical protein